MEWPTHPSLVGGGGVSVLMLIMVIGLIDYMGFLAY